ncbi:MAG: hypothetical protein ACYCSQ_10440 [bacterium]
MDIKVINTINNLFQPYSGLLAIIAIIISIISGLSSILKPFFKKLIDFIKWIIWKFNGDFKITAEYDGIYPLKSSSLLYEPIKNGVSISPNYLIVIKIYIDTLTQNANRIKKINFDYKPLIPILKECSEIINIINNTEFHRVTESRYAGYSQTFKDNPIQQPFTKLILVLCSNEKPSNTNTRVKTVTITDKNNKKYRTKVEYPE